MEISDVRRRVLETIERSRGRAAARRARADRAARDYEQFLDRIAVPLVRQIANALRAAGYPFTIMTPAGAVRMTSEKSGQDFVELSLDDGGDEPRVVGRTSRIRGRHIVDAERVVAGGDPATLTEEEVLEFLMKELEPFVER
jgi:hypothetical protein